jgi:hypothetical protein
VARIGTSQLLLKGDGNALQRGGKRWFHVLRVVARGVLAENKERGTLVM